MRTHLVGLTRPQDSARKAEKKKKRMIFDRTLSLLINSHGFSARFRTPVNIIQTIIIIIIIRDYVVFPEEKKKNINIYYKKYVRSVGRRKPRQPTR